MLSDTIQTITEYGTGKGGLATFTMLYAYNIAAKIADIKNPVR
jgi:hypothetical protein